MSTIAYVVIEVATGEQIHLEAGEIAQTSAGDMPAEQLRTAWMDGELEHVSVVGLSEIEVGEQWETQTIEAEAVVTINTDHITRIFDVYTP